MCEIEDSCAHLRYNGDTEITAPRSGVLPCLGPVAHFPPIIAGCGSWSISDAKYDTCLAFLSVVSGRSLASSHCGQALSLYIGNKRMCCVVMAEGENYLDLQIDDYLDKLMSN